MQSHSHIFIPSTKKDVAYCSICSKLSYKGVQSISLPLKSHRRFNIDPLSMKYKPITAVCNYKLPNNIKFIENKIKAILKIKYLTINFGLNSMIYYKAINLVNQIFLENDIPIDVIDTISSLCLLLVVEFNECCIPSLFEENITKDERDIFYINNSSCNNYIEGMKHKSNLRGLFGYIKKYVNNYKYWEVLCLKYLNYDLGKFSAYDYLILFFKLGIFFCEEKVNIIDKLKYCINILDLIIYDKKFCEFSQYTYAMSIIKVSLEKDNLFDKKIFKYIYGVDLSKSKYVKCSNLIKSIINKSLNNYFNKNYFNILNNMLFLYNQREYFNKIKSKENEEEEKNDNINNNYINRESIYKFNNMNIGQLKDNHIERNKNNFVIQNYSNSCNYNINHTIDKNSINNKFDLYNNDNNYFFSNNEDNNCNKNFR